MRKVTRGSTLIPEIRLAKKEDLPVLIDLDNICIKEEKFHKKQWEYLLLRAKSSVFIALIDGKIIGSIVILLRRHIANARIYILNVHPEYRRKGVGSLLMDTTLKFLTDMRYKRLTVETGVDNLAAIDLYGSKGFSVDKILNRYYSNGKNAMHFMFILED